MFFLCLNIILWTVNSHELLKTQIVHIIEVLFKEVKGKNRFDMGEALLCQGL